MRAPCARSNRKAVNRPRPRPRPCRALAPTATPHLLDETPAHALFGDRYSGIKRLWSAFQVATIERLAACKGFRLQARPWRKHDGRVRLLAHVKLQVKALSRATMEEAGARACATSEDSRAVVGSMPTQPLAGGVGGHRGNTCYQLSGVTSGCWRRDG